MKTTNLFPCSKKLSSIANVIKRGVQLILLKSSMWAPRHGFSSPCQNQPIRPEHPHKDNSFNKKTTQYHEGQITYFHWDMKWCFNYCLNASFKCFSTLLSANPPWCPTTIEEPRSPPQLPSIESLVIHTMQQALTCHSKRNCNAMSDHDALIRLNAFIGTLSACSRHRLKTFPM
jgi:hypothetical protein